MTVTSSGLDTGTGYGRPPSSHDARLTEAGPGTPMGEALRRYWHPIATSSALTSDLPPRTKILDEDLIIRKHGAEVHAETLDVLLAAIAKPVVSHQGQHFSFEDIRLTPNFLRPAPPVWAASTSAASAHRAGARGLKMCSGFTDVDKLVPVYEAYQEGARSAGMPTGPDQVGLRRQITLVDEADLDRATRISEESLEEFQRVSFEAMKIPDAPKMHVDPDELIAGTPQQVADEIIRQCRALSVGNFLAIFNIFEPAALRRAHELFGREVIPRLRAAEIS